MLRVKVNDLVLIVGADDMPVQGVVVEIMSPSIAKVKTTTGVRTIFMSALHVLNRPEEVTA